MIQAYLDESGIHDGAAICCVAGYFGGKGQFKKFEHAWRAQLRDFDVPMEEFHAKDLFPKPAGFFAGWNTEICDQFLSGLVDAITKYEIHPVSSSVIVSDFNSLSHTQRRFFTGATLDEGKLVGLSGSPRRAYYIPFHDCLQTVACYAPVGGLAHFFCGLDRSFYEYALVMYKDIKETWTTFECRERLGNIAFPLAKETPQLQAADLLVHLSYQREVAMYNAEGSLKTSLSPPDGLLGRCLAKSRSPRDDHSFYDKEGFQQLLDKSHEMYPGWDMN